MGDKGLGDKCFVKVKNGSNLMESVCLVLIALGWMDPFGSDFGSNSGYSTPALAVEWGWEGCTFRKWFGFHDELINGLMAVLRMRARGLTRMTSWGRVGRDLVVGGMWCGSGGSCSGHSHHGAKRLRRGHLDEDGRVSSGKESEGGRGEKPIFALNEAKIVSRRAWVAVTLPAQE